MKPVAKFLKNYAFPIGLLFSILIGALLGVVFKKDAAKLKPLGDIFLNLLFTAVVPFVFFSISSAIAVMSDPRRLRRIFFWMLLFFTVTGIIASVVMVIGVKIYPPAIHANSALGSGENIS